VPARPYKVTITTPHVNGLPADAIVNTWHFRHLTSSDRDADQAEMQTHLDAFYTAWVGSWGSTQYNWNAMVMRTYDMLDPVPRFPFDEATFGAGGASGTLDEMPAEVACVLSMEGARVSGENMRRRRGRVFLGPFVVAAGDMATVPTALITAVTTAANTEFLSVTGAHPLLCIYSPYTHFAVPVGETMTHGEKDPVTGQRPLITPPREEDTGLLLDSFTDVYRCWVDNAWDTQRRRGPQATSRTIVSRP